MYQFASGLLCGLIGVCALGLIAPETGSNPRQSIDNAVNIGTTVNRATKGSRLQTEMTRSPEAWKTEFNARIKSQVGKDVAATPAIKREDARVADEMPVGCEPAVSSVLDDVLAKIPSRCLS